MSVADRVRRIVEPLLAEQGLECFDVEFGGGRLVVMADRPGGVDLDALTEATHRISAALDREDPVPGHYLLEVSSPGLERRLRSNLDMSAAGRISIPMQRCKIEEDICLSQESARSRCAGCPRQ